MTHQPPGFIVAVVDDDEGILRSLEYLLESADYAVRLFHSGTELLDGGCLKEIDCLISDIDMPGMDGFELLRLVHAARPGLPIILITGYPDTLKRLPPLGGSNPRFFTKPFNGPSLILTTSMGSCRWLPPPSRRMPKGTSQSWRRGWRRTPNGTAAGITIGAAPKRF